MMKVQQYLNHTKKTLATKRKCHQCTLNFIHIYVFEIILNTIFLFFYFKANVTSLTKAVAGINGTFSLSNVNSTISSIKLFYSDEMIFFYFRFLKLKIIFYKI
jgi:hypothetical protein